MNKASYNSKHPNIKYLIPYLLFIQKGIVIETKVKHGMKCTNELSNKPHSVIIVFVMYLVIFMK